MSLNYFALIHSTKTMTKKFLAPSCEACKARLDSVFSKLPEEELSNLSIQKHCNYYQKGEQEEIRIKPKRVNLYKHNCKAQKNNHYGQKSIPGS